MNETCDRDEFLNIIFIASLSAERLSVPKLSAPKRSIPKLSVMAVSGIMAVDAAVGAKFCLTLLFWATSFNTLRLNPNR